MSPLFGSKPDGPTQAELQAAEVDRERIRQGGIPLGAEERLKRIGATEHPFFTSDLSAKEYALAVASGFQPVALVMGSSVVQHGWGATTNSYYQMSGEVRVLSDPWNLSRERAFGRLTQEARLAGADGVIGVEISGRNIGNAGSVELVVFGTAVRDHGVPSRDRARGLGMCTLSGQEVDKLRRIGAEVCGIVGFTSVVCTRLSMQSNWVMNAGSWASGNRNIEIPEISSGVYQARSNAMREVLSQARSFGANEIVVSTLSHTIEHREYEGGVGNRQHFFYVTMNVLGTAVRLGAHAPHPSPLPEPMMSISLGR